MPREFFEDCRVGDSVTTPARTITEGDIVNFAAFSGDWMPLHTDAEFAKTTIYGERVAHGMLVLAVGTGLLIQLGEHGLLPRSLMALYGLDKVRFTAPVKIGDTIHSKAEIAETTKIDEERGLLKIKGSIVNRHDEPVIVFTMRLLVGRKP